MVSMPGHTGLPAAPSSIPASDVLDPLDLGSTWLLPPELLEQSPSRQDKVSDEEERKYRRRTVMFMETFQKQVSTPEVCKCQRERCERK